LQLVPFFPVCFPSQTACSCPSSLSQQFSFFSSCCFWLLNNNKIKSIFIPLSISRQLSWREETRGAFDSLE
jgi:hypothetical protein